MFLEKLGIQMNKKSKENFSIFFFSISWNWICTCPAALAAKWSDPYTLLQSKANLNTSKR